MQALERVFKFEGFTLDLRRGCLRGADGEIELRPKSFEVLRYLVENAGRLVPKDEIISAVWPNVVVTDESLARCVSDVRLALGDGGRRIIRTVPRRGYLFITEPEVHVPPPIRAEGDRAVVSPSAVDLSSELFPALISELSATADHRGLPVHPLLERRQMTILACEFAAFSVRSRQLDPEDLRAELTAAHQYCAEIIDRHYGYVARYLEDGLLAYFGYPHAREHDAENAVRAGLALLRSQEGLGTPGAPLLQPRIGLASGVVVIADESDNASSVAAQPTAVGETLHLARQLQLAAERGNLLIDQNTRRLVGGLFEFKDLEPVILGGSSETVSAWCVLGPTDTDSRFEARREINDSTEGQAGHRIASGTRSQVSESGLSPFVGRGEELEVLEQCIAERQTQPRVIDIVGEPGIGKSRLLHEFRRRQCGSRARIWTGNCWPGSERVPFRPFIEVMRNACRIRPADPEVEIVRKLEAGLAVVGLNTAEHLGLLLNLLGLKPSEESLRGLDEVLVGLRTRDLLLNLVQEGCRAAPVIIVLEDLHWIDSASQEFLVRLIENADAGALTIIHTRRPEYSPPWVGQGNTTTLFLQPLAANETSEIVRARLGVSEPTGTLVRLITGRAEGNPLFAEEIANFLIDAGKVRRAATCVEYDADVVAAAVPGSVQSLLTARVDRLASADRALLQAASVLGRRFAPDLLTAVAQMESVEARLVSMERLDLVRRDASTNEFVFKHALVRDALYASLPSGPRQALHFEIAGEIERRNLNRLGEVVETLAHHYTHAHRSEKAIKYLTLAGEKAIGIYSLDEGEHALRTALTLAHADEHAPIDERTAIIMADLALVYYMQYRLSDTIALIEPDLDRIRALGDTRQTAILLDLYGVALFASCRFREATQMAATALAIADRLADPCAQAHARAGVIMMSVYVDPNSLTDFESFAQRAYAEAEEGDDTYTVVRMTLVVANNYLHRGLLLEGRQYAYRLMKFGRDRQDRRALGMALWLLGWFDILADDFTAALGHGQECVATALAPYDKQWGQHVVGVSQLLLGRVEEGIKTMDAHRRHALANGWSYAALLAEAPLGVSLLLSGHLRKGIRALQSLVNRSESEYGYQAYADWTRVFISEFYVALLVGNRKPSPLVLLKNFAFLVVAKWTAAKKAEALLRTAIKNPQFSEQGVIRARIEFNLGLLCKATRRPDLARAHFANARNAAVAQQAKALLAKIDAAEALS